MTDNQYLMINDIEQKVCDIAAEQLNLSRSAISPDSRLIQDLHCDSIDLIELIMELEDRFSVTIPNSDPDPVCKAIFIRKEFRLSDIAEIIYIQQGTGKPERSFRRGKRPTPQVKLEKPFCQLGGQWDDSKDLPLFEQLSNIELYQQFRRTSDGMRCVMLPSAIVEIGSDDLSFEHDSRPSHKVELDSFLIDAEPVSTTAFCRFLNSIGKVDHECSLDWFLLTDDDDRAEHMLIEPTGVKPSFHHQLSFSIHLFE